MLPDYPEIKEKLSKLLMRRFTVTAKGIMGSPLGLKTRQIFEGDRHRIQRDDGSVDDNPFRETSVETKINLKEFEEMSQEDIIKKLADLSYELGDKQSESFFEMMSRITEETGNVATANGKPFSIELFLKGLETIEIDFKPDGEPILPTIIAGKELIKTIKEVLPQLDSNPEYKKRHEEIMERKRQEWRARENSRKLVG